MAHVYAGELSRIDHEVLEAVKSLPDDFYALAEVNIGRNVDWFIVRPKRNEPATMIITELKRLGRPIRGTVDGYWERLSEDGEWQEIEPTASDMNYYWQAVNSANSLGEWLYLNQHMYRESHEIQPPDRFKVWPDLLLLSPPGTMHRLPVSPSTRYGRWFYSIPVWLNHLLGWNSRINVELSPEEVQSLVEVLRLEPVWIPPKREPEPAVAVPAGASNELAGFVSWMMTLEERISRLEAQLNRNGERG